MQTMFPCTSENVVTGAATGGLFRFTLFSAAFIRAMAASLKIKIKNLINETKLKVKKSGTSLASCVEGINQIEGCWDINANGD